MDDWSLRTKIHSVLQKRNNPLTAPAAREILGKITESLLAENPHVSVLRECGVDLAADPNREKHQAITAYLTKIFGLSPPDSPEQDSPLINPDVMEHLDHLVMLEVAHILMVDPEAKNLLAKKLTPVLYHAQQAPLSFLQSRLSSINIPREVLDQLNIDPATLKEFNKENSISSYSFSEIKTLLKKDLNKFKNREEIKHLALAVLWDLPKIYAEYKKGGEINYPLLDKLNFIVGNSYLENGLGIIDQAALVYYCVKKTESDIESSQLDLDVKEALGEICDGVILNLVRRLKDSPYTGSNCMQLPDALETLKVKVSNLDESDKAAFDAMSYPELEQRAYIQKFKADNPDLLKLESLKAFDQLIAPIRTAVDQQWQRRKSLVYDTQTTILKKMNEANKIFLPFSWHSSRFALTCMNQALDLLNELDPKHLVMDRTTCQEAFPSLNRYANRLDGDPKANIYTVLKDFLAADQGIDDLQEYLYGSAKAEINKVGKDSFFQSMRNTANRLKASQVSLVDDNEINTKIEKYGSEKVICFANKLPTQLDAKSLVLGIEYIDPDTDLVSLNSSIPVNLERLVSLAAYKVVNGPARRIKSPIVINDLNDSQLIQSIDDSKLIRSKNPSSIDASEKLQLTICGNWGEDTRISSLPPRVKLPNSPKSPTVLSF